MPQSKIFTLTECYYRKILNSRLNRYDIKIERLVCHKCEIPFNIGEEIAAKQNTSRIKRNYYHPECARLIHLL